MDVEVKSKPESVTFLSKDDLKHLKLNNVQLTDCVLGQGSYGTVYKAEYDRTACAAKQLDISQVKSNLVERVEQNFLLECLQHSKLSHPNIVKMLGVFYPKKETLPVLVMELMEYNLTQLLKRSHGIPLYVKLSILQDVSRGLCYLHAQNPPVVHQALYSDNILFAKGLVAKIGDFKTGADTVSEQALLSTRRNKDSSDFLPYRCDALKYDLPLNVFSYGCIVCHVITQKWPKQIFPSRSDPSYNRYGMYSDQKLNNIVNNWCVAVLHQAYVEGIADYSLKHLAEACLQNDPKNRPHISQIHERVSSIVRGEP